jgi:SAM-dependent methyltransferase
VSAETTLPPRREAPSAGAAPAPAGRPSAGHEDLGGALIRHRRGWRARINAWRKRTPLNPYWIERKYLRLGAERLAPFASGVLLDIGGGERPYEELFAPHVERYVGLEYPPMCENLVPEIWGVNLPRVQRVVDVWGDGKALPFATGSFDCVLLSEVIEHVPEPEGLLIEAQRVLRPGGRALVTAPFMAPLHQLPYDYYRFTPEGLRAMFARAGLVAESIEPRGNSANATGSLLTQYLLRTLGARQLNHDGSVTMSRWRAPLVLPLLAAVQGLFALLAGLSSDHSLCLGWTAVARKPVEPGAGSR